MRVADSSEALDSRLGGNSSVNRTMRKLDFHTEMLKGRQKQAGLAARVGQEAD